jgi:hypothetical protein
MIIIDIKLNETKNLDHLYKSSKHTIFRLFVIFKFVSKYYRSCMLVIACICLNCNIKSDFHIIEGENVRKYKIQHI